MLLIIVTRLRESQQSLGTDRLHSRVSVHPDTCCQDLAKSTVQFVCNPLLVSVRFHVPICIWACRPLHMFQQSRRPILIYALHSRTTDTVIFLAVGVLSLAVQQSSCRFPREILPVVTSYLTPVCARLCAVQLNASPTPHYTHNGGFNHSIPLKHKQMMLCPSLPLPTTHSVPRTSARSAVYSEQLPITPTNPTSSLGSCAFQYVQQTAPGFPTSHLTLIHRSG